MNELSNKKFVLLAYYQGAYGPTVRIDIQTMEDLIKVRNIFSRLSQKIDDKINLAACENIKSIGVDKFVMVIVPKGPLAKKKLHLVNKKEKASEFLWQLSSEDCETIDGLIEGLVEDNTPGHQYLSEEGIDDALVELAYMEFRPSDSES